MAEIDIQQRRSNTWAWVIGIVIIALIIWGLWELFDRDAAVEPVVTMSTPAALMVGADQMATRPGPWNMA